MPTNIRKSYNSTGSIYFFTATIHKWLHLLETQENKKLIAGYLHKLCLRPGSWHTKRNTNHIILPMLFLIYAD